MPKKIGLYAGSADQGYDWKPPTWKRFTKSPRAVSWTRNRRAKTSA